MVLAVYTSHMLFARKLEFGDAYVYVHQLLTCRVSASYLFPCALIYIHHCVCLHGFISEIAGYLVRMIGDHVFELTAPRLWSIARAA